MKIKLVKQYQCYYCGKKKYSASAMIKHEKHCTLNPNRKCRMCELMEEAQPDMAQLLAILPDPNRLIPQDGYSIGYVGLEKDVKQVFPEIQRLTNNCPACIMACLRQKGIPIPAVGFFDYNKELKIFWDDYNDRNADPRTME